jgi:hypothetical protein
MNAQEIAAVERALTSVLDMFAKGIERDGVELFTAKVNAYVAQGR